MQVLTGHVSGFKRDIGDLQKPGASASDVEYVRSHEKCVLLCLTRTSVVPLTSAPPHPVASNDYFNHQQTARLSLLAYS